MAKTTRKRGGSVSCYHKYGKKPYKYHSMFRRYPYLRPGMAHLKTEWEAEQKRLKEDRQEKEAA